MDMVNLVFEIQEEFKKISFDILKRVYENEEYKGQLPEFTDVFESCSFGATSGFVNSFINKVVENSSSEIPLFKSDCFKGMNSF